MLLIMLLGYGLLYVVSLLYSVGHRVAKWNALLLTIPIGVVTVITITETLTPWLLRLPFHHCPFCLFFQHPLALIFIVLIWIGLVTPWLTLATNKLARSTDEAKEVELAMNKKLVKYGAYSMLIGLVLILVDILMVFS
jgi:hypothetical protein